MIFSITEPIFEIEDKLLPVSNMASSGLKKMFYIILRHLRGLWENVVSYNILTFIFIKSFLKAAYVMPFCNVGRCYAWQMLLLYDMWQMLNH